MEIPEDKIAIKYDINGKEYILICNHGSPLGEIHDVLFAMKQYIIQRMQNVDVTEKEDNEESSKEEVC